MTLLISSCATQNRPTQKVAPLLGQAVYHVEDIDVLTVSPEIEAFLGSMVSLDDRQDRRAWNLVWAATDRNLLSFDYDPSRTLSAKEAFSKRTGNCLSFSHLMVAMARNRGLQAWYQEVEVPPTWSSSNNTVLVSKHVNMVLKGHNDHWVVDISGEDYNPSRRINRISDEEAKAQHYNNLGAEALTENDLPQAFAYFSKALEISPRLDFVWSNLGVVYNRNGQTEDAKSAYLKAIDLDATHAISANNLYLIYQREGDLKAAGKLKTRVDRHRRKNPYYLHFLAAKAYEEGRFADSTKMLQKAILLQANEYRFHYDMARVKVVDGDLKAARASLDRAAQLAPDGSAIGDANVYDLPPLLE